MQWEVARAASEQHALGACVESLQGHVIIGLSLHGWHLSRGLRAFLARLIVPFSSSELGLRATAHIYPALWPFSTKVWGVLRMLVTAYPGPAALALPLPLVPGVVPTAVLSEKITFSGYVK
jgi:hypothetical protein